jgi:predicted RND superfamily exporter protein
MIDKIISYCLNSPKKVIYTFIALFILSLSQIPFLNQVSDISQLISKDDKVIELNTKMEKIFGSTRLSLLSIKDGITTSNIKEAKKIHSDLQKHQDVVDVISIFSEKYLSGSEGTFEVEDLVQEVPTNQTELIELKKRLKSFPLYKYALFNEIDLNLMIQFKTGTTDQEMSEIINNIIQSSPLRNSIYISGWPEINNSIKGIMDRDLFILIPLIFVIITIIFYFLFGSWRGIIVPLLSIIIAITCSTGFMALCGISLNVVSNSIPILLVAIGTSDGIHFLTKYYHYAPEYKNHRELLSKTTRIIAPTILLTSITTMGGFLANLLSPVQSISEFGVVTAVGVVIAGLASYILTPAILTLFSYPILSDRKSIQDKLFIQFSDYFYIIINKYKFICGFALLILVTFSASQIFKLRANYTLLGYFSPQSAVVKSAQVVSSSSGGLIEFNIVVDTKKENGLLNSKILNAFDQSINEIKSEYPKDIVYVTSLADYIKNMSKAYNGSQKYYRVPKSNDEIAQYLEVYSWSGEVDEDLKYVTNDNYSTGRIFGRFKLQQSKEGFIIERNLRYYEKIVNRFMTKLNSKITVPVEIKNYGELPMWIKTLYDIVEGQILSVIAAIIVVFLMALPILKSLSLTFIGLIPIIIAISFNFAFMNAMGIQLDIATSLVSAMAIGIGIDDALHFLLTFKRINKENNDYKSSLHETMRVTGKAMFATSVTLILGYSVFFFSSFTPINHFGLLNIVTIILATFATILAIPLAILIFEPLKEVKK